MDGVVTNGKPDADPADVPPKHLPLSTGKAQNGLFFASQSFGWSLADKQLPS